MKVCREHGIRVTEIRRPALGATVALPSANLPLIGYLCPITPARVLRGHEVVDPDD